VVTLTLARPERRNALDGALLSDLTTTLAALGDDPATRAIVLTGAPPVFSAGADLGRGSDTRPPPGQFVRLFSRLAATLERLEQPVVAALNGHAVGGGWALALCCDFRLAAETAQCWVPEVDMGIALHPVLTAPFVRLAGPARAREIAIECRRYSAPEQHAMGLVHRVVPGAALAAVAHAYAAHLAAKPPRALAEVKARVDQIARIAFPLAGAMTEGVIDRPQGVGSRQD
jgi:enoyl-CoA hydratase/carnithine racemase